MRWAQAVIGVALILGSSANQPAQANAAPSASIAQEGQSKTFLCRFTDAGGYTIQYAVFQTAESLDSVKQQWNAFTEPRQHDFPALNCHDETHTDPIRSEQEAEALMARLGTAPYNSRRIQWQPQVTDDVVADRRTETVFFGDPKASLGEKGYSSNTFEVEYQFITCQGELHLAYSVMENSVRSKQPTYLFDGVYHKVSPPAPEIASIPLFGEVWLGSNTKMVIGQYADDHASKALGWGCFSGQTKKIANVGDLTTAAGKPVTKDELPSFIKQLRVNFVTKQVLTSTAAEEEIRSGTAEKAAEENVSSGQADLEAARADRARRAAEAAEARAAERAAKEADFEAKRKAYEEGVVAHRAAVEQYQKALADTEAAKGAGVAQAKAAQEEFARKRAEYEAEAARARKAQEEYEAKYGSPR